MVYVLLKKLEALLKPLNILIRCDASVKIGLGHVTRCLVLANEFRNKGHSVFFAVRDNQLGINKVKEQGFQYFLPPSPFNYHQWLTTLSAELNINIFIGDIRDGLPIIVINTLKKANIITVAIDEPSDYRKACDLCFYPPHAQLAPLDWTGFKGKIKQGLEYVLLRPEFYSNTARALPNKKIKNVLIMLGGTDPMNLTLPVVKKLKNNKIINLHTIIANDHPDKEAIIKTKVKVHFTVKHMHQFLQNIDYAIISFGVSAYELIALGIPSTHILLNEDHEAATKYFVKAGLASSLRANEITDEQKLINYSLSVKPKEITKCQVAMKILKEVSNAL